ncbi:MAG: hypothetical protein DRJ01_13175 [Bacteroidetes bacterium]|nr:MAG: hypothetical protein DRJ01_13175 [Bacteroidota bacterium]
MNKRLIQKRKTRKLILKTAKNIFITNGFINTTTVEVAKKASIAHGTLFLHFKTKDILILEIFDEILENINNEIQQIIVKTGKLEEILARYLDLIQQQESFFSVIARELPFYSPELRRKILFRDSIIRSYFHKIISKGIETGIYRKVDVSSAVTYLFGAINYYLSFKTIYITEGSVIGKFKDSIIKTFIQLLVCD